MTRTKTSITARSAHRVPRYGVPGISEREERGVVLSSRLGQRPASGSSSIYAFQQLSPPFSASEHHQQPDSEAGERSLWPCPLRTATEPRHSGDQFDCDQRRPPKSHSVRHDPGASRHCPTDVIGCPVHRRNLRWRRWCRHLCYR